MGLIKSVEGEGESVKGFGDGSEMRRRVRHHVKLRQWRWVRDETPCEASAMEMCLR